MHSYLFKERTSKHCTEYFLMVKTGEFLVGRCLLLGCIGLTSTAQTGCVFETKSIMLPIIYSGHLKRPILRSITAIFFSILLGETINTDQPAKHSDPCTPIHRVANFSSLCLAPSEVGVALQKPRRDIEGFRGRMSMNGRRRTAPSTEHFHCACRVTLLLRRMVLR